MCNRQMRGKKTVMMSISRGENLEVEFSSDCPVPRVQIINFGCGCSVKSGYSTYSSTPESRLMCWGTQLQSWSGQWVLLEASSFSERNVTVWQLGPILLNLIIRDSNFTLDILHFNSHQLMEKIRGLCLSNGKKTVSALYFCFIEYSPTCLCSLAPLSSDCEDVLFWSLEYDLVYRVPLEEMWCYQWLSLTSWWWKISDREMYTPETET